MVLLSWFSTFRTEFTGIYRSTAAGPSVSRSGAPAFRTEFSGIYCTAAAGPLCWLRFRFSAFCTELAGILCTAFTFPCTGCRLHLWCCLCLLLHSHLIKTLHIGSASLTGHSHTHKSCHGTGLIGSCCFHGICLRSCQCSSCHCRRIAFFCASLISCASSSGRVTGFMAMDTIARPLACCHFCVSA